MKHFLGVQNGSIFVSFLCIFTNFFLVLLRKRTFWWLLLCIFTNRKNCRQQTRRCGQGSIQAAAFRQLANSIRRRAFHPGKNRYSFSCQLLSILLLYRAQRLLTARLISPGASRQTSRAAIQLFLQSKSQPPGIQQHSFLQIYFILQPLPCFSATSHKKN